MSCKRSRYLANTIREASVALAGSTVRSTAGVPSGRPCLLPARSGKENVRLKRLDTCRQSEDDSHVHREVSIYPVRISSLVLSILIPVVYYIEHHRRRSQFLICMHQQLPSQKYSLRGFIVQVVLPEKQLRDRDGRANVSIDGWSSKTPVRMNLAYLRFHRLRPYDGREHFHASLGR